jgi:hypothetical protein
MNDVITPKRPSLKPKLVARTMFLKLDMSLIPSSSSNVTEPPIWNTLLPSRLELLDDIDDSNDNENEEDKDDDDNNDDLSLVLVESEEAD